MSATQPIESPRHVVKFTFRNGSAVLAFEDTTLVADLREHLRRYKNMETLTLAEESEGLTAYEATKGQYSMRVWAANEFSRIVLSDGDEGVPYKEHFGLISPAWLRQQGWTVQSAV